MIPIKIIVIFCLILCAVGMQRHQCGHDHKQALRGGRQPFRDILQEARNHSSIHGRALEQVRIPVVFHIFHSGVNDITYISDEAVNAEMQFLNDWFSAQNAHYDTANSAWDSVRAVAEDFAISFELAKVDPTGAPSTGIYRYESSHFARSGCGSDDMFRTNNGGVDLWPTTDYYSVYVCSLFSQGFLGYAYLPTSSPFFYDAMVLSSEAQAGEPQLGNTFYSGSTFSHETGHYFGLDHTFANDNAGCDDDDLVTDTPQTDSNALAYVPQSAAACGTTFMRCNGQAAQVQNNMDYNYESCLAFFSKGQVAFMRDILFAPAGQNTRSSLRLSTALDVTCTADCNGRVCGADGCGGLCGSCNGGFQCNNVGQCEAVCTPNCNGRVCGDNGCGGLCGSCNGGFQCSNVGQCEAVCTPNCNGRVCGDDGCGGSCGTCQANHLCSGGQCACQTNCQGRQCGDDGCGGVCGTCGGGFECNNAGLCDAVCTPNCNGRECGDDGCGLESCGMCTGGQFCSAGICVDTCTPNCGNRVCGDDGCGSNCGICSGNTQCNNLGECEAICTPNCNGRVCGGDGCGGSCGTCQDNHLCNGGQCTCQANCGGRNCGDDGCGGTCGTCGSGFTCRDNGVCESTCVANCNGRECGGDGCEGTCGSCSGLDICDDGICITPTCDPNCINRECGGDGCGGSCGSCDSNTEFCNEDSVCELLSNCVPSCDGKQCGPDGCGNFCGDCLDNSFCNSDFVCETVGNPNCDSCGELLVSDASGQSQDIDFSFPDVQVFGTTNSFSCSFEILSELVGATFPSFVESFHMVTLTERCNLQAKGISNTVQGVEICLAGDYGRTDDLCLAMRFSNGKWSCVDELVRVSDNGAVCGDTTGYGLFAMASIKTQVYSSYSYQSRPTTVDVDSTIVEPFSYFSNGNDDIDNTLSFTSDQSSSSGASQIVLSSLVLAVIVLLF